MKYEILNAMFRKIISILSSNSYLFGIFEDMILRVKKILDFSDFVSKFRFPVQNFRIFYLTVLKEIKRNIIVGGKARLKSSR